MPNLAKLLRFLAPGLLLAGVPGSAPAQLVPIDGIPGVDTRVGVEILGMPLSQSLRPDSARPLQLGVLLSPSGGYELALRAALGTPDRALTPAIWTGVSTIDRRRFYGFGNDTRAPLPSSAYEIRPFQASLRTGLLLEGRRLRFSAGPEVRYVSTSVDLEEDDAGGEDAVGRFWGDDDADEPTPAIASMRPYGVGDFATAGLAAELEFGSVGPRGGAMLGASLSLEARWSPALLDATAPYATAVGEARAFYRPALPGSPVLAARIGAQVADGPLPYFDAAYVGGHSRLRGYRSQRYAGDEALWAGIESRVTLARASVRGRGISIGALSFVDAGRVTVNGSRAGGLHFGYGGGLWLGIDDGPSIGFSVARGEDETRFYARLGVLGWY